MLRRNFCQKQLVRLEKGLKLEFCCLMSGWDDKCTACPFEWYGFDPRFNSRRSVRLKNCSQTQELEAKKVLEMDKSVALTKETVKKAFRKMALKVHPDKNLSSCGKDFRRIVDAYELLATQVTRHKTL